ncbi:unnamed protein product [Chrysoparadoxa australica]
MVVPSTAIAHPLDELMAPPLNEQLLWQCYLQIAAALKDPTPSLQLALRGDINTDALLHLVEEGFVDDSTEGKILLVLLADLYALQCKHGEVALAHAEARLDHIRGMMVRLESERDLVMEGEDELLSVGGWISAAIAEGDKVPALGTTGSRESAPLKTSPHHPPDHIDPRWAGRLEDALNEAAASRAHANSLGEQLVACREELEAATAKHQDQISALEGEMQGWRLRCAALEKQRESLRRLFESAARPEEVQLLQAQLTQEKVMRDGQLGQVMEARGLQEREIQRLEEQLALSNKQVDEAAVLKAELAEMERAASAGEMRLADVQEELDAVQGNAEDAKAAFALLEAEKNARTAAEARSSDWEQECAGLREDVGALRRHAVQLQGYLELSRRDSGGQLTLITQLREEVGRLTAEATDGRGRPASLESASQVDLDLLALKQTAEKSVQASASVVSTETLTEGTGTQISSDDSADESATRLGSLLEEERRRSGVLEEEVHKLRAEAQEALVKAASQDGALSMLQKLFEEGQCSWSGQPTSSSEVQPAEAPAPPTQARTPPHGSSRQRSSPRPSLDGLMALRSSRPSSLDCGQYAAELSALQLAHEAQGRAVKQSLQQRQLKLQEEVARLGGELKLAQQHRCRLEGALLGAQEQLKSESALRQLGCQQAKVQGQGAMAKAEVAERLLREAQKKEALLQRQCAAQADMVGTLERENRSAAAELAACKAAKAAAEEALQRMGMDLEHMSEEVESLQQQDRAMAAEARTWAARAAELRSSLELAEEDKEQLRLSLHDKESLVEGLQESLEREVAELSQSVAAADSLERSKNTRLEERLAEAEMHREALEEQVCQLGEARDAMQDELEKAQEELELAVAGAAEDMSAKAAELARCKDELGAARALTAGAEAKVSELTEELQRVVGEAVKERQEGQRHLSEIVEESAGLKRRQGELEDALRQADGAQQDARLKLSEVQHQLSLAQQANAQSQETIQDLRGTLEREQKLAESSLQSMKVVFLDNQQRVELLQGELQVAKGSCTVLKQGKQKVLDDLEAAQAQLRAREEELNTELGELRAAARLHQAAAQEAERELALLEAKLEQAQLSEQSAAAQLARLREELAEVQQAKRRQAEELKEAVARAKAEVAAREGLQVTSAAETRGALLAEERAERSKLLDMVAALEGERVRMAERVCSLETELRAMETAKERALAQKQLIEQWVAGSFRGAQQEIDAVVVRRARGDT